MEFSAVDLPVQASAAKLDENPHAKKAEHDGGHAGQVLHSKLHGLHVERVVARVLLQIDRGGHAQGHDHEGHEDHHGHGAEDGGEDTPGGHAGLGGLGQKADGNGVLAAVEDGGQDHHDHGDDD